MANIFTSSDLKIFQIAGFKERMSALKEKIRPKLMDVGEELAILLSTQFKSDFYLHVAKHMRRKVNPPDETWLALGPEKRGYKAYIYFSLCLGKKGIQTRVVMKDESKNRPLLGENILSNLNFFKKHISDFKNLNDYTKRDSNYSPSSIEDFLSFLEESAMRLKKLKTALFDVGFELKTSSQNLEQDFLKMADLLYPFYLCGLQRGVKLQ